MVAQPWATPTSSTSRRVAFRAVLYPRAIWSERNRMQPVTSKAPQTNMGLLPKASTLSWIGSTRNRGRVPTMMSSTIRRASGGLPR